MMSFISILSKLPVCFRRKVFSPRSPRHPAIAFAITLAGLLALSVPVRGADTRAGGPQFFEKNIRPLLQEYCLKCHSTEKHKGDLDLERFTSLNDVKRHPKVWQRVVEQLADNEMPPKDKPQPTPAEKKRLA